MVSIIIPIYNVEQYITVCLKSVEVQTYTDYEVILVDDCGTDNTMAVAEKYIAESREESFSLVAEEAAVCELPIVGFEGATGAAEWIKDECGILVPYFDLDAMADALYRLYSDKKLREKLGRNARHTITKMYKEESQMKNVISAIKNVTQ